MSDEKLNPLDNLRLNVEYELIETIKSNPLEARLYTEAKVRRVAVSARIFGVMPQIISPDRVILSGNIWLEVAKRIGLRRVPVVCVDHLSESQQSALSLYLVRAVEIGEWDPRKLGEALRDLKLDVDLTGFDPPQVDFYIQNLDLPSSGPDRADKPAPTGPLVSRLGDLWRLRDHRLLNGSALDAESYRALLMGELCSIVFTDPPYNVKIANNVSGLGAVKHSNFAMGSGEMADPEFTKWLSCAVQLMIAHSKLGSLHYICMDWRHQLNLLNAGADRYSELKNVCVWTKSGAGMGSLYRSQHEFVFVFKNGTAPHRNNVQLGRFGRDRSNVWAYPSVSHFGRKGEEGNLLAIHPTVKPVALVADAILDSSVAGEIVLDPFIGSGTTIVAAERTRRRCYGIELEPKYVDAAVRRWQAYTGLAAILDSTGQSFDEVASERGGNE